MGDDTTINGVTQSTSKDSGALVVEGGVGVEKIQNGSGTFTGRLDVDDQTESSSITSGFVVIDGGLGLAVPNSGVVFLLVD